MPFISARKLVETESRQYAQGFSAGVKFVNAYGVNGGYIAAATDSGVEWYASTYTPNLGHTITQHTHLDALNLVLDAFNIRSHYESEFWVAGGGSAAQRFWDDLVASKKVNDDLDAAARIDHVADVAGSGQNLLFDGGEEDYE